MDELIKVPDELIKAPDDAWFGDVDYDAWKRIVESRGGCACHISPPCSSCDHDPTEEELNDEGYTYGTS